jgi:hypothetical protein
MYYKTIFHTISNGEKLKFTIRDRIIDKERFFYANMINIELDFYEKFSKQEKENYLGMEITNGKQQSINYKSSDELINDLLTKYGNETLETEK